MSESLGEGSQKPEIAPPKKKSLFSKQIFTKPRAEEDGGEAVDFFSRAKDLYPIRVAEEQRKREKKLERKRSTVSAERRASRTPEVKKRRISSQADERSCDSSPNQDQNEEPIWTRRASTQSTPGSRRSGSSHKYQASPTTLSERYARDLNVKKGENWNDVSATQGGVISLVSDSDDEVVPAIKRAAPQSTSTDDDDDFFIQYNPMPIPEEDDLPTSEEEFPELVAKARERERERQKAVEQKSLGEQKHSAPSDVVDDIFHEPSIATVDPIVDILITSEIEGAKPMIFKRKISQVFKPVREGYCEKQIHGPPELKALVFLTWRGKKLFDAGTCAFLGLRAGRDGKVTSSDNSLDEHGRLHVEAWTESLFMAHQRRLEQGAEETPQDEEEPMEQVKLFLRAKGMEPIKMKVKPTTRVQKMVNYVRNCLDVPEEKDIQLFFDGDKLDPNLEIKDTELGDMDTVEIHVR